MYTSQHVRIALLAGLFLLLLSACQLFRVVGTPMPDTPTAVPADRLTPPQPESSRTALLPTSVTEIPLTPMSSASPSPSPVQATATPQRWFPPLQVTPATTQMPPMAELIPIPAGEVNLLLLGSDYRPEKGYHTDVIMLVTINPRGSVSLTSFPRDLYVYIPGWRMQRINIVQPYGGFTLSQLTMDYNFGIRPDHYIMINFNNFQLVVESLGGIDVDVAVTLHDARDGYPDGYTVLPGRVHMDGETALWYVRARMTTSDIDRERRAQEVIVAIGRKLFSLNALGRVPEFYNLFRGTVETDLTLDDLLGFLPFLVNANPDQVYRYVVGRDQVTSWVEPVSGAQLLLPKPDAIRQLLLQAVGSP